MIEQSVIFYINLDCFYLIYFYSCLFCYIGVIWGYICCFGSGIGFWGRTECCCRLRFFYSICFRSYRYRYSVFFGDVDLKRFKIICQIKICIILNFFKQEINKKYIIYVLIIEW